MPAEIYFSKFVECILAINLFWCFFLNNFFQSIFQNIFAQLPLIIYTSSTFFIFSLVKSSNRKSKRCKHFITLITIFTENFGEEISHIGECSEVFQGSVLCPLIYQDRRSAEMLLGSTIFIPQLCFRGIFNLNQKGNSSVLYKDQQFQNLYSNFGIRKWILGYYPNSNVKPRGSNLDIYKTNK